MSNKKLKQFRKRSKRANHGRKPAHGKKRGI